MRVGFNWSSVVLICGVSDFNKAEVAIYIDNSAKSLNANEFGVRISEHPQFKQFVYRQ